MPLFKRPHDPHDPPNGNPHFERLLRQILENTEAILADTTQVLADLAIANTAIDGIVVDIANLEAIIAAGGTPQEIADAVAAMKARLTDLDAQRS